MDIRDFLILWDRSQPNGGSAEAFLLRAAELAGVAQELREDYATLADHMVSQGVSDARIVLEQGYATGDRTYVAVATEQLHDGDGDSARDLATILRGDAAWAERVCVEVGRDLAERGVEVSDGLRREENMYAHIRDARLTLGAEEAWHLVVEAREARIEEVQA
jgi:hypothetical protein